MVCLLYRSALVYDYTVVPLMVLQVIVILVVAQSNIALFGNQKLLGSVFIDHIPAIVRCGGSATYLMNRS